MGDSFNMAMQSCELSRRNITKTKRIETMTRKQIEVRKKIERKLSALRIDIAGASTNSEYLAMCDRFLFLREWEEMLQDLGDK